MAKSSSGRTEPSANENKPVSGCGVKKSSGSELRSFSERTVTRDGQSVKVKADADYFIRAIREPGAEVTEGYPAVMPPYPGLSDADIKAMQSWLETLK